MKSRRILGSVLATVLASTSLVVVATASSPASAVTPVETRIVARYPDRGIFSSYSMPVTYGDSISIYADVEGLVNGVWTDIYPGQITVTQQLIGSKSATTVATSDSAYLSKSITARGNADYTLTYSGATTSDDAYAYAPTAVTVRVKDIQRKLDVTPKSGRKKLGLAGKISPKGTYRVIVLKKVGKKWKKYKGLRTTSRGTFFARLPAPSRRGQKILWKLAIPGSGAFSQTNSGVYYTTKY